VTDRAKPRTRVLFTICSRDAQQAYLCVAGADGTPRVIKPMTLGRRGEWRSLLELEPGTYRYRFYVVDERGRTVYFSPADGGAPCRAMDGLDAVLHVPSPHPEFAA
jgi:hypothetical protein